VYSLQRGPGADREGVRLSQPSTFTSSGFASSGFAPRVLASSGARSSSAVALTLFLLGVGAGGCAAAFGQDGTSVSLGTHADGALRSPSSLPLEGDGYTVPARWRTRNSNFGTDELVGVVVRATRSVEQRLPGGVAAIGDLSRRAGGASVEHKSHQNGRDVDVFYYALDENGRPVVPGEAMFRFNPDGRAFRWSPARGQRAPNRTVPPYHFDARRNWALVRALVLDPGAEVQWIFIQHQLAALLLREAAASGEDPAVLARAAFILREPTDSEPHDDHMHVRLYCDARDRAFGCVDKGPVRWWKKLWKYMAPPFGRAPQRADELADVLLRMVDGELPALFFRGSLSS
jgi:penicillin-insensitive murein endopeptidase